MYRDIPEQLKALIEPVVRDHALELVDLEVARGRGPWRLRATVDTPSGDGLVSVERCAGLSREIATQLAAAEEVPADFQLEVSSPGLDRVLAREKDFAAACGAEVRLETRVPIDGRRRFRGRLVRFEAGRLHVVVDGQPFEIPFTEVARARRLYEFTRADFARQGAGPGAHARAGRPAGGAGTEQA